MRAGLREITPNLFGVLSAICAFFISEFSGHAIWTSIGYAVLTYFLASVLLELYHAALVDLEVTIRRATDSGFREQHDRTTAETLAAKEIAKRRTKKIRDAVVTAIAVAAGIALLYIYRSDLSQRINAASERNRQAQEARYQKQLQNDCRTLFASNTKKVAISELIHNEDFLSLPLEEKRKLLAANSYDFCIMDWSAQLAQMRKWGWRVRE